MRLRYTRSWESARQEQLLHQSELKESLCLDNMKKYRNDIEHERSCHAHSEMFLIYRTDEMRDDCEKWMHKFEEDYDAVETDTQVCRDRIEETLKRTAELQQEFDKRQQKMDAYLKRKQDKIDMELNLLKLTKLTILVQVKCSYDILRNELFSL